MLVEYFPKPKIAISNQQNNHLSTSFQEFDFLLNSNKPDINCKQMWPAGAFVDLRLNENDYPLNMKYIKEVQIEKRKALRAEYKD